MIVFGLLQNQWFKDPERAREVFARCRTGDERRRLLKAALDLSHTGRVLRRVFGDLYNQLIVENASPEIGGRSSAVYRADHHHILMTLHEVRPDVVFAFGVQARLGLQKFHNTPWVMIEAPHPAARYPAVERDLRKAVNKLKLMMEQEDKHE